MTHDPVAIIKSDHTMLERLFKEYEELGDAAYVTKRRVIDTIIKELTIHADMEEACCYPRFKEVFNKEDDKMVDEAYVEHAGVKKLLGNLQTLEPEQPEFDATVNVLMEQVRHHVKEEEEELLPAVQKQIKEEELESMGSEMMAFKSSKGASM